MNHLYLGRDFHIEPPPGPFLLLDDEVPDLPFARIFDARVHPFNPLLDLTYKKLRQIVGSFDTLFPSGDDTLTKLTGLSYLADALASHPVSFETLIPKPDKSAPSGHLWAYERVSDLMRSPNLKRMLTSPQRFPFPPDARILARVNRVELTDFDAEAITFFLMATYPGQIIVPDFGFYGRDFHAGLIREQRLIAGVRFLDELPKTLRQRVLMIEQKTVAGALYDDAVLLAKHAGLSPDPTREDNSYNLAIKAAMVPPPPAPPQELWIPPPILPRPEPKPQKPRTFRRR